MRRKNPPQRAGLEMRQKRKRSEERFLRGLLRRITAGAGSIALVFGLGQAFGYLAVPKAVAAVPVVFGACCCDVNRYPAVGGR